VVSSLAYPNLLGNKRLGCCCCIIFPSKLEVIISYLKIKVEMFYSPTQGVLKKSQSRNTGNNYQNGCFSSKIYWKIGIIFFNGIDEL
jgi:hypothetical protein